MKKFFGLLHAALPFMFLLLVAPLYSVDFQTPDRPEDKAAQNVLDYQEKWAKDNYIGSPTIYFAADKLAVQAISDTTWTKVSFPNEKYDTANTFDSDTNHRFIVPEGQSGYYTFSGNTSTTGLGANDRILCDIVINASQTSGSAYRGTDITIGTGVNGSAFCSVSMVYLEENTYVEFWVYQDSGGSINTTADYTTHFEGGRIR